MRPVVRMSGLVSVAPLMGMSEVMERALWRHLAAVRALSDQRQQPGDEVQPPQADDQRSVKRRSARCQLQ